MTEGVKADDWAAWSGLSKRSVRDAKSTLASTCENNLVEDDCLGAVEQDPPLGVPSHSSSEHRRFDGGADGRQASRVHVVSDLDDVLLCAAVSELFDGQDRLTDDRSLVKVSRRKVSRRANRLDALVERLVIGPRSSKARQERVMNVDDSRRSMAEVSRDDLHEASEDDEVNVMLRDELEQLLLRFDLCVFRPGEVVKGLSWSELRLCGGR